MVTTIQVREENLRLLEMLKRATKARSYDEVLSRLLRKELGIPRSMFGAARGKLKPFTEADRLEDRE